MMLDTRTMIGDGFREATKTEVTEGLLGVTSRRARMKASCSAITALSSTVEDVGCRVRDSNEALRRALQDF